MSAAVKICGLTRAEDAAAAAAAGARFGGLVFFPRSPRHLDVPRAAALARAMPEGLARVGLFVDPSASTASSVSSEGSTNSPTRASPSGMARASAAARGTSR